MISLKPQSVIDAEIAKSTPGLSKERKQALVATIQATHPDKREELSGIFRETIQGGALKPAEAAFIASIAKDDGGAPIEGAPAIEPAATVKPEKPSGK